MHTGVSVSEASNNEMEVLSFRLGTEEYGISILKVQEIRGYDAVTRIANAPAFLKGVINLRGQIVPIVDMRIKFALGQAEYDAFTVVIILNIGRQVIGMVVDSVSDVITLAPEQVRPAPSIGGGIDASNAETGLEITWSDRLNDRITLQPDLQVILDPGGEFVVAVDRKVSIIPQLPGCRALGPGDGVETDWRIVQRGQIDRMAAGRSQRDHPVDGQGAAGDQLALHDMPAHHRGDRRGGASDMLRIGKLDGVLREPGDR